MLNEDTRDPEYWSLLSDVDKEVYLRIRSALAAPSSRNKRNTRIDDFKETLDAIDIFVNIEEEGRWKRSLVCGVCRLAGGIAVNPGRLQHLIMKCKSSINGSLSRLGYAIAQADSTLGQDLLRQLPALRKNPAEWRQWSLRSSESTHSAEEWAEISPPVAESETPAGAVCELRTSAPMEAAPPRPMTPINFEENFLDGFFFDFTLL